MNNATTTTTERNHAMTTTIEEVIAAAVERFAWGKASARKAGRDPRWPYLPEYIFPHGGRTIYRGLAYATREEALAVATNAIENEKKRLAASLMTPGARSLRESLGLPRELADLLEMVK